MNEYKPSYHFLPPSNWMNDPNGPIFVNGEYHLFYQYNPYGDQWGTIHWGHAKSKDLIHWDHLPVALYPSIEKGENHCFSGCTVIDNGKPVILYTSVGDRERNARNGSEQWIAYGSQDLLSWEKPSSNPIMKRGIHGPKNVLEWRDPFVWKKEELWFMICSGSLDEKGCVFIYCSKDLLQWEFLNVLASGEEAVWECPNLFEMGDKTLLIYSPDAADNRVRYRVGTIQEDYRFHTEYEGILDYGGREGFYAPTLLADEWGRCVLLGWMPDSARGEYQGIQGWSGTHAIPRLLELSSEGRLRMQPIPQLTKLRDNHRSIQASVVKGELETAVKGKTLEFIAEFECDYKTTSCGIKMFKSPDGEEETVLWIDFKKNKATLNRSKSSLHRGVHTFEVVAQFPESPNGRLRLHIFLDRSTIEVFINEETCLSARVYPQREDSEHIQLFCMDPQGIELNSFDAWQLKL